MDLKLVFNIISIVASVFLIICVLVQNRGQSLGQSFGGDSGFHSSKRGAELVLFNATIVLAVVFVLSVILGVLTK